MELKIKADDGKEFRKAGGIISYWSKLHDKFMVRREIRELGICPVREL